MRPAQDVSGPSKCLGGVLPLTSCVIATFNMGRYICGAVRSVLEQTYSNLEVVVVDDGSSDDTASHMQAFTGDKRVRFLRTARRGQPAAKNLGASEAGGDLLAFCDADDFWTANKLSLQVPLLLANGNAGVVYGGYADLFEDGSVVAASQEMFRAGRVVDDLFVTNFVPFGTALLHKRLFDDLGGFDETLTMGIDWDLWLRAAVTEEFRYVPEVVYLYRRWSGQMSRDWQGRYEAAFRIMDRFRSRYPRTLSPRTVRRAYADSYANLALHRLAACGSRAACTADAWRAIRLDPFMSLGWRALARSLVNRPYKRPAYLTRASRPDE